MRRVCHRNESSKSKDVNIRFAVYKKEVLKKHLNIFRMVSYFCIFTKVFHNHLALPHFCVSLANQWIEVHH